MDRPALKVLVIAEVAMALVIMVQAGLLGRAFIQLQRVDPGFVSENVLTYSVALPQSRYSEEAPILTFFQELLQQSRQLPGVKAASAISSPPLGRHWGNMFEAEGAPEPQPEEPTPVALMRIAQPGYLESMGVALREGRDFTEQDGTSQGTLAVIVNQTFAERSWPGQSALGKRVRGGGMDWMTVVAVAQDVRHYGLDQEVRPTVYLPHRQYAIGALTVVLRTSIEPQELVASSRRLVTNLDPDVPIFDVATMSERLQDSVWLRRAYSWLFALFAGISLLLSVTGLYGVLSYAIGCRHHEIGVRMALGAQPGQLTRQFLAQGLALVFAGVMLGLVGAILMTRLTGGLLFGIGSLDLVSYGLTTAILLLVAAVANWIPARRAARIDPMKVLTQS